MGIPGRRIEKDWPPEKVMDLMHEHGGIIKNVAKEMGCAIKTLYDLMDMYPEIRDAQILADDRLDRHVVENYYDTLDKLASMTIEEPAVALNAVKVGLLKSKKSRYYTAPKEAKQDGDAISPAQIAAIAGENADLKKKIAELESRID